METLGHLGPWSMKSTLSQLNRVSRTGSSSQP